MKKSVLSLLMLLVSAVGAQAKYWKIGPSSVAGMDFASINAAMESDNVAAGDTLYLDQYYNESLEQTVTKAVVIIGTGYDTALNDEQVVARLTNILNLKSTNIVVKSVRLTTVQFWAKECTLDRCYSTSVKVSASIDGTNHIYSCFIEGDIVGYGTSSYSSLNIQNCVVRGQTRLLTNSTINNNTMYYGSYYTLANITNSVITNNIIMNAYYKSYSTYYDASISSDVGASGSGNTIEHNLMGGSEGASYYPTNKYNLGNMDYLFENTGTYSNIYKLNASTGDNAALGYATDGGEVGCHGGMFGCPSGGRPQYIPYFKKVQVGSRTEDGKLPVTLKIAIQSE